MAVGHQNSSALHLIQKKTVHKS